MQLRAAKLADCRAIAALHVAIWHDTYRDLAPPEALEQLDVSRRVQFWQQILSANRTDQRVVVAVIDDTIVAFGAAGPSRHPIMSGHGEIMMLYVASSAQRRGIGRRLMFDLASLLRDQGHTAAALAVVDGNGPAIAFYRSLGARQIGTYTDPGPIWKSNNLVYAWDDVAALIENVR